MKKEIKSPSPWTYISTLYFAQGVPNTIVTAVAPLLYKRLAISNEQITFWISFLRLPWVLKMFWAPFIDTNSTKRTWILTTQFAMFACLALAALSLQLPNFFPISLAIFAIAAFVSATCDIATDGFYMLALSNEQQAFFVGFRSLFFRFAVLFGSGFLLFLAGTLEKSLNNIQGAWTITLGFAAILFILLSIYHRLILPKPPSDIPNTSATNETVPFWTVIKSYFQKEKIGAILAFILLYRLGEAMFVTLAPLFLVDTIEAGGLGLSTDTVGIVNGTFGVISLIVGGILGGITITRYGLKKCLLPMALAMNLPNLFYVYMAYTKPPLALIYLLVSLEQFGYGLGFTGFTVYLLYICQGQYKTSHYAISTGFMALGLLLPGAISGAIQKQMGYPLFFIFGLLLTLPGIISIFFIPLEDNVK
ncbi:MFS transporter [Dulcicalothrix desertica]|nr:MFS transporter [Dulcicalothrix desertica]TWH50328.1 PAT family beta-lactamase induction signal transducer AmpG [Dulcicalothrix desertica PCC 7102]